MGRNFPWFRIMLFKRIQLLRPPRCLRISRIAAPGRFSNALKRTVQSRVKAWKALYGPDKEIMFRQNKQAGRLGLFDFTELGDIEITLAGQPLDHRLYHFRLPYSG